MAGVHIAAGVVYGVVYMAVVECPDRPLMDRMVPVAPSKNLAGAEQLLDFKNRLSLSPV